MTTYLLKPRFQNLLRPLLRTLAHAGVTPNQLTCLAALISVVTGALMAHGIANGRSALAVMLLPPVLLLRMALNALDGMLAREHAMQTRLGAILNELGDAISDAALYLPLAWLPWVSAPLQCAVVVAAIIAEMTGVLGVQVGASRRYDGPMGKSDRAACFGAIALLLAAGIPAGAWLNVVLTSVLGLLGLTVFNRARQALHEVP